jgi:hypothetical protein
MTTKKFRSVCAALALAILTTAAGTVGWCGTPPPPPSQCSDFGCER